MKVVKEIGELKNFPAPRLVTIGNFDGVHIGHQQLISKTVIEAQENNQPSLLVTFHPHPRKVFARSGIKLITTTSQKLELIEKLGVDITLVINFREDFYELTGEEFIKKILVPFIKPAKVNIGYDFRFGKAGSGDFHLLDKMGEKFGFEVEELAPVMVEGEIVSSSSIRKYLLNGNVRKANRLLGRYHFIEGKIVPGKGRGRTLGIPTANMQTINELVPLKGVYATFFEHNGTKFPAVTNIGYNPTFEKRNDISIETYIFYFDGDLYNETVRIHFVERIRDEKKFSSAEDLIETIREDIKKAKEVLDNERY